MLDFDDAELRTVKYWALKALKRFRLEGFIVLKSSDRHYHVVFSRRVSWVENLKITAWVSLLSNNSSLQKWFIMQCIKEGSTLRVSNKMDKPSPRIVFRYGSQDGMIAEFLAYRNLIKSIIRKLQRQKNYVLQQ
jgi:hypothetical protein